MKLLKSNEFKGKSAFLGDIESVIGVNNGIVINNKIS